jgi:hypothetical protein
MPRKKKYRTERARLKAMREYVQKYRMERKAHELAAEDPIADLEPEPVVEEQLPECGGLGWQGASPEDVIYAKQVAKMIDARNPSPYGLHVFVRRLLEGATLAEIAEERGSSPEFAYQKEIRVWRRFRQIRKLCSSELRTQRRPPLKRTCKKMPLPERATVADVQDVQRRLQKLWFGSRVDGRVLTYWSKVSLDLPVAEICPVVQEVFDADTASCIARSGQYTVESVRGLDQYGWHRLFGDDGTDALRWFFAKHDLSPEWEWEVW